MHLPKQFAHRAPAKTMLLEEIDKLCTYICTYMMTFIYFIMNIVVVLTSNSYIENAKLLPITWIQSQAKRNYNGLQENKKYQMRTTLMHQIDNLN